jgi:hypothetical protein
MVASKLRLSQPAFEKLHADLERAKRGSTVKVDKEALRDLLIDHGHILGKYRELEVT